MKKMLIAVLALVSGYAMAQNNHSCCSKPTSNQTFAMLGNDKSFKASHLSPLPFNFMPDAGKMISFSTSDGKSGNAFAVMSATPSNKYILMIHEWWGLNDYITQEAEKLQKELGNVNVLAIDLYDGKVGTNAEEAGKYMKEVKEERAKAIINGAIAHAGKDAHIGTIGWCFGGGWSLQAAILAGKQTDACVMYYGMPETDVNKLKTLHSDVFGIFAAKDAWINKDVVKGFENNMKAADKTLTVKMYDADHAFANPSNPKYSKEDAADAHALVLDYFKAKLK